MADPESAGPPSDAEVAPEIPPDFLGAFAVVERPDGAILFVGNDRHIGGRAVRTWDLPGGQVERGELLTEALVRELREETELVVRGEPRFLFVQDGERRRGGERIQAWRSFFFAVDVEPGEPRPGHEVRAVRWLGEAAMTAELTAPYHDSFLRWRREGGQLFRSTWSD